MGKAPAPNAPWRDFNTDTLARTIYNEVGSFRGSPEDLDSAMWKIAQVIKNRQAQGEREEFEGEDKTLANQVLPGREINAINAGYPPARSAFERASKIADEITSNPEAYPSPWPYTRYNTHGTNSTAPHAKWGYPVKEQIGPFKTYMGDQWLNIYDAKAKPGVR